MMTFHTINLKRGIKHVFLLLDTALRLGDTPLILFGTDCTGNITYLLRGFGNGVFVKPPRENPRVQAKVIVPCLFLCQPLCACGRLPLCLSFEPLVAQHNLSSRRRSSAELFSRSDIHGPCAQFLDSCSILLGVAFSNWTCRHPLRSDLFVLAHFLVKFQRLVALTGKFWIAKPAYIGCCFVLAGWASTL